jgi:hypothetical protein
MNIEQIHGMSIQELEQRLLMLDLLMKMENRFLSNTTTEEYKPLHRKIYSEHLAEQDYVNQLIKLKTNT